MNYMMNILCISMMFFCGPLVFGQYNPVTSMNDDFKQIAGLKSRQTGFEGLQTYNSGEVKGSQFFYPGWANGSVTTIKNEVINKNYQFLFDRVRHELFIIFKLDKSNPKEVLQAEKNQVKTFTIITDRDHVFVPGSAYHTLHPDEFYEVLEKKETAFTLLKLVKTRFVKFDSRDMLRVKRGEMYDEFIDKTTYYLVYGSEDPKEIEFTRKSIISVIPSSKKELVTDYFNDNEQREQNDDFLIKLVQILNN